eukprot:m51a1_g11923 putative zrc1p (748) ;mRNA; f:672163-675524
MQDVLKRKDEEVAHKAAELDKTRQQFKRFTDKYMDEKQERIDREREIEQAKQSYEQLLKDRAQRALDLENMMLYQRYMAGVVEHSDEWADVRGIIDRWRTLTTSAAHLEAAIAAKASSIEERKQEVQKFTEAKTNEVLALDNKIAVLQRELQEVSKLVSEDERRIESTIASTMDRIGTFAQVTMACGALLRRVQQHRKIKGRLVMTTQDADPTSGDVEHSIAQLEEVCEYATSLKDIIVSYKQQGAPHRSLITRYVPSIAPVSDYFGDGRDRDDSAMSGEVVDPTASFRGSPTVQYSSSVPIGGFRTGSEPMERTPLVGHESAGASASADYDYSVQRHDHGSCGKHDHEHTDCRTFSFWSVAIFTLLFCIGELFAAVWTHSLMLMTDGFHKLSDVVSVFIAWWAIRAGKQSASFSMSYGWARTEVVGSLTNAVFLLSLCLYILLDAIPQFINPENETGTRTGAMVLIVVSGAGLVVNFIATVIFAFSGQHHHHHGHSHGHDHGHDEHEHEHEEMEDEGKIEHGKPVSPCGTDGDELGEHGDRECKKRKERPAMDLNVKAVFLHFLGDSITSLFVLVIGGLLFFFATHTEALESSEDESGYKWLAYMDPAVSVVMIVFILCTTLPLTTECIRLLMQTAPETINAKQLQRDLLRVDGVLGAHALHVWEFVPGTTVCTVHIKYLEGTNPQPVVRRTIAMLHGYGIQHVTVQPEVVLASSAAGQSPAAPWQIGTVSHEESQSCVVKHLEKK